MQTRTPASRSSVYRQCEAWFSPALAPEYGPQPGQAWIAQPLEMLTINPLFCSRMTFAARRQPNIWPVRFSRTIASIVSSVCSSNGAILMPAPALLTRISRRFLSPSTVSKT